jgi:hypothetical protein
MHTMSTSSPHALLFLLGALLLAASACSPVAAGDRMAVVHSTRTEGGGEVADIDVKTTAASTMRQRRLDDAVAPEFPSAAVGSGLPGYAPLLPDRPSCEPQLCAAKCAGCAYTRPCTYIGQCAQGH